MGPDTPESLDKEVRLLRFVLDDRHVQLLGVDLYPAEVECRESRLEELPRIGALHAGEVSLGPAPVVVLDRARRHTAVFHTKDNESGAFVLCAREAE